MKKPKITNKEEAFAAVKQDGMALKYVPEELMTVELCLEAIKNLLCKALSTVPQELRKEVGQRVYILTEKDMKEIKDLADWCFNVN